jgi:hypothetical protein
MGLLITACQNNPRYVSYHWHKPNYTVLSWQGEPQVPSQPRDLPLLIGTHSNHLINRHGSFKTSPLPGFLASPLSRPGIKYFQVASATLVLGVGGDNGKNTRFAAYNTRGCKIIKGEPITASPRRKRAETKRFQPISGDARMERRVRRASIQIPR